mmetsp:Transcript_12453/g.36711  ORF Transcript_12453/g.36711 Transcript_12453/m.36711 type:complete len:258 (-) Transcript_12453:1493-2266(-)
MSPFAYLLPTLALMTSIGSRHVLAAAMSTGAKAAQSPKKKGALIFLHGLGDTPAGWSSLQHTLPQMKERLKDIEYVFPPAPTVGITINGGMEMPGWFDLYDWPIGVGSKDDREGKLAAVATIDDEVERLERECGLDPSKVVVGGFSQGGAIALLSSYRREEKRPLAACAVLSAWLTLVDDLAVPESVAKSTPLLWAHGTYDDKVLFEQQAFGMEKLKKEGVAVTGREYPMGHESCQEEIETLASFVDEAIFGSEKDL